MLSEQKNFILDNPWETPKQTDKTPRKGKAKGKSKGHKKSRGKSPKPPRQSFLTRLFHAFHNDPSPNRTFVLLVGLALVMWLATGFYYRQTDDRPIVLHLGGFTQTVSDGGWHYRLPSPLVTISPAEEKTDGKCDGLDNASRA